MLNLVRDVIASICKDYLQKKNIVQRKFAKIGTDDFLVFCCYFNSHTGCELTLIVSVITPFSSKNLNNNSDNDNKSLFQSWD